MWRSLLLRVIARLYSWALPATSVDLINSKLIEPVPGLIIDGRQYFRYTNPDDMPPYRYIVFLSFRKELSMGADKDLLNQYHEGIREANNKGDRSQVGALLMMLDDTINNLTPLESYYWMAALQYFDPAVERTAEFDYDLNKRKVEAFKGLASPGFFLTTLTQDLTVAGEDLPSDINTYLKQVETKLKAYEELRTAWRSKNEQT